MRFLIAGGTGFIGMRLSRSLLDDNHQVWILTRNKDSRLPKEINVVKWDGKTIDNWKDLVNQIDVVVNLTGLSLASGYWTSSRKKRLISSRIEPGRALAQAINLAQNPPDVFLQISGVGYYGSSQDPVNESSPPGSDFPANICIQWESASELNDDVKTRRVIMRTAVVLDRNKGMLPLIALPVKLFVGGSLGSGQQGFPWIHVDDLISAMRFLIDNSDARGVYNLSGTELVSINQFIKKLAKVLRRPFWFPVPGILLKMVLGELSIMLLDGQFAKPQRIQELGFKFKFETVEEALEDIYK